MEKRTFETRRRCK